MPEKKTDVVRGLVASGDFKKALKIAKNFRLGISKEDKDAMSLAYECIMYPAIYEQMNCNVNGRIELGIEVITRLYGNAQVVVA